MEFRSSLVAATDLQFSIEVVLNLLKLLFCKMGLADLIVLSCKIYLLAYFFRIRLLLATCLFHLCAYWLVRSYNFVRHNIIIQSLTILSSLSSFVFHFCRFGLQGRKLGKELVELEEKHSIRLLKLLLCICLVRFLISNLF